MIDHIILTVSDFARSVAFYAKALKPPGITSFIDYEGQAGHPDLKVLVMQAINGIGSTCSCFIGGSAV
jgi:catechol 2,3-dioxygenase-like lactoylglutathione lyase family enzyme